MIGETISHYRIVSKLGQGGMGEVYLAEDTRLGRKVALKFLAPELTRDRESLIRFRNEARAAADLSHPNIATIHDIGEVDGKPFLVLEYLEGQTLRERSAEGPLPIDDILRIGKALAAGLAEAHAHGIVHRDIKSANIILTNKAEVKILDFGLAHRDDATQITREGTTLGTIGYMSPEQAKGKTADERSDIWGLGIVLYECLTGRLPFTGAGAAVFEQIKTSAATPPTSVRTGVPMELEHAVLRCLEKDPELRFQHADDLLASLRAMESHQLSSGHGTASISVERTGSSFANRRSVSRVALILAAAAVILLLWQRPWIPDHEAPSHLSLILSPPKITPFLSTEALETSPAWSPTGNLVAYAANTDGVQDIWLCDLDGSSPLNLTRHPSSVDAFPEWSPDGQFIAFYSTRDGPGIYTMTVTGGNVRRVLSVKHQLANNGLFFVQWVDTDRIIYSDTDANGRPDVYEYRMDTGETRCLTISTPGGAHRGRINNRGTHLLYVRPLLGVDVEILVQDLQTGEVHTMPLAGRVARWSADGQTLLIISTMDGTWDLWSQDVDLVTGDARGEPRRLTSALSLSDLSLSPDGLRAIATQGRNRTNIWSLPTNTGPLSDIRLGEQLTDDDFNHSWARWLPDGTGFLEVSDRRGSMNVWKVGLTDGGRSRLNEEHIGAPFPSPDGRWIVCYLAEDDGTGFPYLMRPDGSGFRELAPSLREQFTFVVVTDWSINGRHLLFHTRIDDEWKVGILTLDEDAGIVSNVRVLPFRGGIPFWSPDGRFIVFQRTEDGQPDLYVSNFEGNDVYRLTNDATQEWVCGWEDSPSRIYYKNGEDDTAYRVAMDSNGRPESDPEIWIQGSRSLVVRQFLDFRNGRAIGPMHESNSDLWLLEFEAKSTE